GLGLALLIRTRPAASDSSRQGSDARDLTGPPLNQEQLYRKSGAILAHLHDGVQREPSADLDTPPPRPARDPAAHAGCGKSLEEQKPMWKSDLTRAGVACWLGCRARWTGYAGRA